MSLPHTFTLNALGTRFYVEIHDVLTHSTAEKISASIYQLLNQFEKRYSRFLFDSIVSTLNRERTFLHPDQEFITLLEYGRSLTARTQGLFNILLEGTLSGRGYDTMYSFIPNITEVTKQPNPLTDLDISLTAITLYNGSLDLGGFGKGYVIDMLARHLQETYNLRYFLINGGGDMYATSNQGEPFTIYLEHPFEPETYIGTTEILNQGFAASSPHKRSWIHDGKTYHHIVNTTTSNDLTTNCDATFVTAHTCVEADAFATISLMVDTKTMLLFAEENRLNFATFTTPNSLISTDSFVVHPL